jgi:Polysaccharide deacetylase
LVHQLFELEAKSTPATGGPPVKLFSILYHDVVRDSDFGSSGFVMPGAAKYKIDAEEFERHLAAIAKATGGQPASALDLLSAGDLHQRQTGFLLTFDDGGSSAATRVAGLLDRYGWRGHFLVTTGYIGAPGFVSADQIRALRSAGHIVGSHSHSHPPRMSACTPEQLREEWKISTGILSEILGEPVVVASVPAGWYSPRVAEAATEAGIRVLFNSQPTSRPHRVSGCLVLGRYCVMGSMRAQEAAGLASGQRLPCLRQAAIWNLKKVVKLTSGGLWLQVRNRLLANK